MSVNWYTRVVFPSTLLGCMWGRAAVRVGQSMPKSAAPRTHGLQDVTVRLIAYPLSISEGGWSWCFCARKKGEGRTALGADIWIHHQPLASQHGADDHSQNCIDAKTSLISLVHLSHIFHRAVVVFLPPEHIIDGRKEDDRTIYQNVPVHTGCIGVGRGGEERQYEKEDQECHRDDIDSQAPPA